MPILNVTITENWTKVADSGTSFCIMGPFSSDQNRAFEVAPVLADVPPAAGIFGLPVRPAQGEGVYRDDVGPGYIYARTINASSMILSASVW